MTAETSLRVSYDDRPQAVIHFRRNLQGPKAQYSYDKKTWFDCHYITNESLDEAVKTGDIRPLMVENSK